jgi:hypothetical protein
MPLIDIPKDARKGKPPCGECHLKAGETCNICGAHQAAVSADEIAMILSEDARIENGKLANVGYLAVKIAESIERALSA